MDFGLINSESADPGRRYSDPDLHPDEAIDGLIGPHALARFAELLGRDGPDDPDVLGRQLGRFLTTPKPWLVPEPPESLLLISELRDCLASGETLRVHGMALLTQLTIAEQKMLFASGKAFLIQPAAQLLANRLCCRSTIRQADVTDESEDKLEFLLSLYNAGQLMLDADYYEF